MSLWPLYRVWNTTALLCACHWNMEAGREEEEGVDPNFIIFSARIEIYGFEIMRPCKKRCSSHVFNVKAIKSYVYCAKAIELHV